MIDFVRSCSHKNETLLQFIYEQFVGESQTNTKLKNGTTLTESS